MKMKLSLQFPTKNVAVNQAFGKNDTPIYAQLGMKGHNGIDFFAPDGTPILATHDGVVVYAGLDGSNGNLVVLKTDVQYDYLNGQAYFKTLYGHLKDGTICVHAGERVKAGQVIAQADNTGASSGSHLHFGLKPVQQGEQEWVWYNLEQNNGYNVAIDPTSYFPQVQEFTKTLKLGDKGVDVAKMQAFFIRHKYMAPVAELGYYGPLTAKAVLKFQLDYLTLSSFEKNVLRGTLAGPKTIKKLNEIYS